ncbi:hypothetical protein V8F06_006156 [Rhypophila decipiens]
MDASNAAYPVYLGVWTNWSRGAVMGLTLTMTRTNANLLIAFVAFYVALVGRRLWRILCFASHSLVSSSSPQNGTYHQHQVIMRNSSTATGALVSLGQVLWAWRSAKGRPLGILVVALVAAALCSSTFIVASGFSSRVSITDNEVLINNNRCGFLAAPEGSSFEAGVTVYMPHLSKMFVNAANYAQECYGNSSGLLGCTTFVQNKLPFTVDTAAPCPFAPELCRTQNANIRLDTGLLDSNDHLGLNAPPENRVLFRKVLHCAPLVTEGYKSTHSHSIDKANNQTAKPMVRYHYGASNRQRTGEHNFTYEYVDDTYWDFTGSNADYGLSSITAYTYNGSVTRGAGFNPLPGLSGATRQADLTLLFLSSNNIPYSRPNNDEWFRATKPYMSLTWAGQNSSMIGYRQDEPASPLGCLEQRQFCSPRDRDPNGQPRCTPLAAMYDIPALTEPVLQDLNGELNRFKWFFNVMISPEDTIHHAISTLHATALKSRFSITRQVQGPLPDNQWQIEVEHMFSTLLASTQQSFVHAAAVPNTPGLDDFVVGPMSAESEELCRNQKVQSTAYASFSLFGLLFIIVLGLLIVLISYLLEPITSWLHKRGKYDDYAYYEWMANSSFHLQRLAHQGVGAGQWSGATDDIPITNAQDKLAVLDFSSNPNMPVLVNSREDCGVTMVPTNGSPGSPTSPDSLKKTWETETVRS